MSDKPTEKPVTFNEAEQLELQQLQQQNESFNAWGSATSRSLHSGQDTLLIANLLQFLKNLITQNNKNIENVTAAAKARMAAESTSEATAEVAPKKAPKTAKAG